jgi:hypothetical protein
MLRKSVTIVAGLLAGSLGGLAANAQTAALVEVRNVVLIHGAWADGSSWGEVIARLQAAGLNVTAVQNPLTLLADSVAATRRALALQNGPTVSSVYGEASFLRPPLTFSNLILPDASRLVPYGADAPEWI